MSVRRGVSKLLLQCSSAAYTHGEELVSNEFLSNLERRSKTLLRPLLVQPAYHKNLEKTIFDLCDGTKLAVMSEELILDEDYACEYFPSNHSCQEVVSVVGKLFDLECEQVSDFKSDDSGFMNMISRKLLNRLVPVADNASWMVTDKRTGAFLGSLEIAPISHAPSGVFLTETSRVRDHDGLPHVVIHVGCDSRKSFLEEELLRIDSLGTLVHELGHAFHALLSPIEGGVAQLPHPVLETVGVGCELLLAEDAIMQQVGSHFETGDPFGGLNRSPSSEGARSRAFGGAWDPLRLLVSNRLALGGDLLEGLKEDLLQAGVVPGAVTEAELCAMLARVMDDCATMSEVTAESNPDLPHDALHERLHEPLCLLHIGRRAWRGVAEYTEAIHLLNRCMGLRLDGYGQWSLTEGGGHRPMSVGDATEALREVMCADKETLKMIFKANQPVRKVMIERKEEEETGAAAMTAKDAHTPTPLTPTAVGGSTVAAAAAAIAASSWSAMPAGVESMAAAAVANQASKAAIDTSAQAVDTHKDTMPTAAPAYVDDDDVAASVPSSSSSSSSSFDATANETATFDFTKKREDDEAEVVVESTRDKVVDDDSATVADASFGEATLDGSDTTATAPSSPSDLSTDSTPSDVTPSPDPSSSTPPSAPPVQTSPFVEDLTTAQETT